MTRVEPITDRDQLSPAGQEAYDGIVEKRGRVGGPFALLMHAPTVAFHASSLGYYLRFESPLPAGERELVTLTAARETNCGFEWAAHYNLALEAGIPQEAIDAVAHRSALDGLDEPYASLIRFARELTVERRVSDDAFEAIRTRYGDAGAVEFTALVGYYQLIASVLNTMEVAPPDDAPALP
jgi:4-carboxymuconolactone decarboxylase